MKWIKATIDNQPEWNSRSIARFIHTKFALADVAGFLTTYPGRLETIEWLDETTPVEKELCVCDFPESGEHCTIHPVPDKVEANIKPPKERDNINLLELVCQLHSRALNYPSKEMHDAYIEARTELETRLGQSTQSDAVEFAEWLSDNQFTRYNYEWISTKVYYSGCNYTTKELYRLFKSK